MNKKKFAALMMVAALVTSSMTAFAADTPNTDTSTSSTGSSTVVDTSTIYSVALPTDNALNFLVDPQGLLNIQNGTSVKTDELIGAGAIVSAEGAGAFIKNQSSADVVVTAKLAIKATKTDDSSDVTSTLHMVDTVADVSGGNTNNMLLTVIPGTEKVESIADYTASTTVVPVTATGDGSSTTTDVKFLLQKADYVITKDVSGNATYEIAEGDDNYDSASFKIGGEVNTNADWAAFNGVELQLTAIFSFADSDGTEETREEAYGLIADDSVVITDYEGIAGTIPAAALLQGTTLWIGPDANDTTATFAADAEITSFKVNGVACEYSTKGNYIVVSWNDLKAINQTTPDADGKYTWTITTTVDGKNYSVTYVYPEA